MQGSYSRTKDFSKGMFYDLHFHGNEELIKESERLGYAGVALTRHYNEDKSEFSEFNDLNRSSSVEIKKCIEIHPKNPADMKVKVQKSRKRADILMVKGGDLKINRAACEDRNVDILSQPYRSRRDTGINHVLAKKAAENKVAIEINLKTFLKTSLRYRYRVLNQFRHIVELHRKFKFPIIITTNASSKYHLKTPQDISAFAKCFGMDDVESFEAISITPKNIIETNVMRNRFIVSGVSKLE